MRAEAARAKAALVVKREVEGWATAMEAAVMAVAVVLVVETRLLCLQLMS